MCLASYFQDLPIPPVCHPHQPNLILGEPNGASSAAVFCFEVSFAPANRFERRCIGTRRAPKSMISQLQPAIFATVQDPIEFLPPSSSAHLVLLLQMRHETGKPSPVLNGSPSGNPLRPSILLSARLLGHARHGLVPMGSRLERAARVTARQLRHKCNNWPIGRKRSRNRLSSAVGHNNFDGDAQADAVDLRRRGSPGAHTRRSQVRLRVRFRDSLIRGMT